jgi:hypothetical protein
MLSEADMGVEDIVKVNQYLTRAEDIPGYVGPNRRECVTGGPVSRDCLLL